MHHNTLPVKKTWRLICRMIWTVIIGLTFFSRVLELAPGYSGSTCRWPYVDSICIVLYLPHNMVCVDQTLVLNWRPSNRFKGILNRPRESLTPRARMVPNELKQSKYNSVSKTVVMFNPCKIFFEISEMTFGQIPTGYPPKSGTDRLTWFPSAVHWTWIVLECCM